jgi:hypothetical protein
MQCSEFETRLCDYLDGTLGEAARREVDQHASECRLCAATLADSLALTGFLERVPEVETPREMVTNILYQTANARHSWRTAGSRGASWFRPLFQPRFAMSMAMTILSVSMLYRVTGPQIRQLQVADLNPVGIWRGIDNRLQGAWERGVKFYENLRFIYEIQAQLRALQADEEPARDTGKPAPQPGQPRPQKLELPSGSPGPVQKKGPN